MNNTFKSNPSKLQNPEKQNYLKINSKEKNSKFQILRQLFKKLHFQ
ncbi:hypothetical protein DB44_BL00020 [Candidatus Protochlamydia amoebophila]|uniref:Uncharacterized protein n=1 Tax=Candidatus Protochlamydia amoebophila TaxID=362787 RepID=A0A0C1K163_9BACT|nr:hypothetical protein DB44_BL00020 [Candidatus Protochlamydia amoebophila]